MKGVSQNGICVKLVDQVKHFNVGLTLRVLLKDDNVTMREAKSLRCAANKLRPPFLSAALQLKHSCLFIACQIMSANSGASTYNYYQTPPCCLQRLSHYIPKDGRVRPHQVTDFVTTFDILIRNNLYAVVKLCASSHNFFIC